MFAGAAREAVFSQPENVRRINADFVPVALKAGLVNNPPNDVEGRLYREIARSMPAPQGIGVVNSAGKVLDWVMSFDDDKSVLAFLDHARKRYAQFPDARKPVPAERFRRFPSQKEEDMEDTGEALRIIDHHPEGESCPGKPPLPLGTVDARLFGRALDKDGKPFADTVAQEHYVEDRFHVAVSMQERLTKALAAAGTQRFRIGDDLARLLVGHAYLGQLDVNPTPGVPGGEGNLKECEFWGRKVETGPYGSKDAKRPVRIRIEGTSEAAGASSPVGEGGDSRLWQHEVRLVWEGLIEVREGRVTRLLLLAHGSEKLKWGNKNLRLPGKADVANLRAGHAIDLACAVRYGIIGEPISASEATTQVAN